MASRKGKQPSNWLPFADAYLHWAHYTDFRYFEYGKDARFGILIELKDSLAGSQRPASIVSNYVGKRFVTADIEVAKRDEQLNAIAGLGVVRIELATPVATPRKVGGSVGIAGSRIHKRLIGVIDDGCPFAHADLLVKGGSRVAFLWDQGANTACADSKPSEFGYGYNFGSKEIAAAINAGTPTGSSIPDEDAVYEVAGQHRLRPLASHGAHVLGLAAARIPAENRISLSRFEADGDATVPPSWETDPDADAALAFVQIPKNAMDDSSGRWLGRHILDGIHALIEYAEKTKTERVTINISFGPQTGPHDGSSLLERAIDYLVRTQKEIDEVFVVVPVGNSYQSRAHAEFRLGLGGGPLTWHVPPDSETPAFLEIWLPAGTSMAGVRIMVTSPDGLSLTADAGKIVEAPAGSWHVVSINTSPDQWMVLVALGATGGYEDEPRPPHGRWTVSVTPARKTATGVAHAYVARNDYNFGGLRRGKPSHLWLENYDPNRFMRSREDDPPSGSPVPPVQICSAGSISGLATGELSKVAAGYRIADKKPANYSSGGPSRGARKGPDWAYPTDESRVFPGLNSWGTRSGASVRLIGTSAASPQYARDIDREGKQSLPPNSPTKQDPRLGWDLK